MSSLHKIPPGYRLITTTDEERHRLLGSAIDAVFERDEQAKSIIDGLRPRFPDIANDLELRSTQIKEVPLRLLIREGDLTDNTRTSAAQTTSHQDRRSITAFKAVSYCWHNDDWRLTKSLRSFWHRFRTQPVVSPKMLNAIELEPGMGLWLDQLCIRQEDEAEQHAAIAAASLIYQNAKTVEILLEDVELTNNQASDLNDFLANRALFSSHGDSATEETAKNPSPSVAIPVSALRMVRESRWYRRAWCYNELCLADYHNFRIPIAHAEPYTISCRQLEDALLYVSEIGQTDEELSEWSYSLGDAWDLSSTPNSKHMDLEGVNFLYRLCKRQSKFAVDRLNLWLQVCGIGLMFTGQVVSDQQIYYTASIIAIACGCAGPFFSNGEFVRLPALEKPTWLQVPDFSTWCLKQLDKPFRVLKHLTATELKLDLLLLPQPRRAVITAEAQSQSLRILEAFKRKASPLKEHFSIQILAQALQWGPNWMTEVCKALRMPLEAVTEMEAIGVRSEYGMDSPATTTGTIKKFGSLEDTLKSEGDPNAVELFAFLQAISMHLHSTFEEAMWTTESSSNSIRAILGSCKEMPADSFFAVPVIFKDNAYIVDLRVWTLRRPDKSRPNVLEVLDKTWGWWAGELEADGGEVVLLKDQIIVGPE